MKANEAPEKLYFTSNENGTHYYTEGIPFEREYTEYTRTDAFMEKVEKWLESCLDNGMWIANDIGDREKEAVMEHFKNYMKGE